MLYNIHYVANDSKSNILAKRTLPIHSCALPKRNKPEAEVIRELLKTGIKKQPRMSTGDALLGLAKLGEKLGISEPVDLSERHDDYLYGDE